MTPRETLDRILHAGLAAADARRAVRQALRLDGQQLHVSGSEAVDLRATRRIRIVGAGKAAAPMARGVLDVLGERIAGGTVTTKDGHGADLPGIDVWEAAHPVPDARGLAGAAEALRLAREAGEGDLLLCLLSGGASALWPAPPPGVSLGDLQRVTESLLRSGAPIGEINAVRKHLSRIAGGQLARVAYPARMVSLLVSDVVGDPPETIAGGPAVGDPTTYADALEVLRRRGIDAPAPILLHLRAGAGGGIPETPKPGDPRLERASTHVVARNRDALSGAAREAERLGYQAMIVTAAMEGEAREVAGMVVDLARRVRDRGDPVAPPAVLLLGGETTVTVRGTGRGGRNQELALAAAILLDGEAGITLAALGTDGTDGPTDAAGGMVDGGTVARGRERGFDARDHLRRNDAYPFLRATGDLLVTGPTGTNVCDLVAVLVEAAGPRTVSLQIPTVAHQSQSGPAP